jgi:hypothetical protein
MAITVDFLQLYILKSDTCYINPLKPSGKYIPMSHVL